MNSTGKHSATASPCSPPTPPIAFARPEMLETLRRSAQPVSTSPTLAESNFQDSQKAISVMDGEPAIWEADRPALQAFVGMMTGAGTAKVVFVTTTTFTSGAKAYVEKVQQRIVLIDGKDFAERAVRHNVGVRIRQTYHLKRVDEDYFSEET